MTFGESKAVSGHFLHYIYQSGTSFEERAEKTCEDLLDLALKTDPGNVEALQALASVRMSQQRPEDAKTCLEQAWTRWKDLDLGRIHLLTLCNIGTDCFFFLPFFWVDDPNLPSIPTRLSMVKLFLELSLFTPALQVLHGVMSADDQEVEAWYLEGWCFFLMSEQVKESGTEMDGLTWEELAKDARDCLETCKAVSMGYHGCTFSIAHKVGTCSFT